MKDVCLRSRVLEHSKDVRVDQNVKINNVYPQIYTVYFWCFTQRSQAVNTNRF